MTSAAQIKETAPVNAARYQQFLPRTGPPWLRALREAAMGRFTEIGFPATHMEDWRFLNIAPIAKCGFVAPAQDGPEPSAGELDRLRFGTMPGSLFVFINGRFRGALSQIGSLPEGVLVLDLAEAVGTHEALVRPHLGRYAGYENESFTALNTAMIDGGLFVYVPRGTVVKDPIHVLNITAPQPQPLLTNPRMLVVAGESCQVTVIEDYVALNDGIYLTNAVTEFLVEANATATHYRLERESREAFNISTLRVQQQRDSTFTSHAVLLGGAIVRNNVDPVLAGEGCDSLINGVYFLRGAQVVANHMRVEHADSHCSSRQFYKGIMSGRSRGMFRGRIIVRPGAQKTDAVQSNQNLLLSLDASANSDPQLEIYADDVKCTHGSTTGQLDADALFYLRSRGISEEAARALLIYAFAAESLERMKIEPIRALAARELLSLLPRADVLPI